MEGELLKRLLSDPARWPFYLLLACGVIFIVRVINVIAEKFAKHLSEKMREKKGLLSVFKAAAQIVAIALVIYIANAIYWSQVAKKIQTESTKTINNLIKETETKTQRKMEQYSTFFDWQMRVKEALKNKEYKKAVVYYDKIIEKINLLEDENYRNQQYYSEYFYRALALFYLKNYKESLDSLINAKIKSGKFPANQTSEANRYFLMNIIQGVIGEDTAKTKQKLEEFKRESIWPDDWLIADLWSLVENVEADQKTMKYINDFVPKYIGTEKLYEIMNRQR